MKGGGHKPVVSLADLIEEYIIGLLEKGQGVIELQRALLAERFRCAPSQISYVISSRFPPERGYITESRRGGGGYIRLTRVNLEDDDVSQVIEDVGEYLSQSEAFHYLARLLEEGHIDEVVYRVMRAALSRKVLPIRLPDRDMVRAGIFKAMFNAYFSTGKE